MSEEGMIPNDELNEISEVNAVETPEGELNTVVGGEQTPEADTQLVAEDAQAVTGEQEAVDAPAEIPTPEAEAEPAVEAEAPVEEPTVEEAAASEEAPSIEPVAEAPAEVPAVASAHDEDEDADEGDHFPQGGDDTEHHDSEVTEDEHDALYDTTGDSAQTLLDEVIGDHTNFDATVEKSTPNELVLLIETIATRGKVSDFAQKVMTIKKSFDKKTDEETTDTALISRFQVAFGKFNKKRAAYYAEREKEKEENSKRKKELLEQLKQIVQEEQVTKISEVRDIQQKWRETGWVAQKDVQPLNETYRQYLDIFYNLRSKYQELLDYDRKYNLDEKKKVIDEIESLIPTEEGTTREEWTARSAKVKNLQEVWRTIGLVPRDTLEEINAAFRNVLDRFYELRSSYYELQDQQKTENEAAKRALLERLTPYGTYTSDKAKAWNEATRKVLAMQEEWKKIGPGPLEVNKQLWKEYRQICDTFFNNKGEYFKGFDGQRSDNLSRKIAICERAEALAESTDWKETAKVLKELQDEWKQIGAVHERHSNKVWKRFRKACDTFFERRGQASSAEKNSLDDNLKKKEELIGKLEALTASENPGAQIDTFNEIQAEWKATGHVPFKLKDKINNAFKEAIQKYFEKSKLSGHHHHGGGGGGRHGGGGRGEHRGGGDRFNDDLQGGDEDSRAKRLMGEIRRLRIRIQEIDQKASQYELNIQYIAKGKSGDGLRAQIQGQIDAEKAKVKELRAKMKEYLYQLENPPSKDAAAEEILPPAVEEAPVAEAPAVVEAPAEEAPAAEAPIEEAPAAESPSEESSEA
jgi:Domain of Unknown Function (DUF349)